MDEPARLAALAQTGLLDLPLDETFDRMARLAATVARVPMAFVSLLDAERQVVIGAVGIEEPWLSSAGLPFDYSLCRHVVASGSPLVVGDAHDDKHVAAHRAADEFGVSAYAGLRLTTAAGHTLGTLCVLDTSPREWREHELECLADVATAVVATIELRLTAATSEHQAQLARKCDVELRLFSDQMPAVGWTTDHELRLTSTHGSLVSKLVTQDQVGRRLEEIFSGSDSPAVNVHRRTLTGERGSYEHVAAGREFEVVTEPLRDGAAVISGVVALARDVTAERQRERWMIGRREVVELIASDKPLREILDRLVRLYDETHSGVHSAMLLLEDDVLRAVAAPSLAQEFIAAICAADVGSGSDCYRAAIASGEVITVADVQRDKDFKPFAEVAGRAGVASCVVVPIIAPDGHNFGVFACHCEVGHKQSEAGHADLLTTAEIAAIAIARHAERRELKHSRASAQRLFENAQDMISLIGPNGRVLSANKSFADALGFSIDELLQLDVADLMSPASRIKATEIGNRLRAGESVGIYELELQARDGRVLTVEVSTQLVYEDGVAVAAQAFGRDVTARKAAELALRQSEQRFALAVEGTADGIWDWDILAQKAYYSPRWKEMLGYADDELADTPETWEGLIHPDERERVIEANNSYLASDSETFECEYRVRHKDGSYRWILSRGKALQDADGKKIRFAGAQRDVTETRELTRELAERESFLRTIFESAPQSIGVITAESDIVALNRAGLDALQIDDPTEVVGTSLLPRVKESDRADVAELHRHAALGKARSLTYEIEGAKGRTTVLRTYAAPFDSDGTSGVLAISENVTEQQAVEATLEMHRDVMSHTDIGVYVYELTDPGDASSLTLVAAAEQATGVSSADVLGERIVAAFPLLPAERRETYRQVALGGDAVDIGDVDHGEEGSDHRVFAVRVFPLPNRRVGMTFTNVTAKRELEAQLRQAQKMEAVGQLAGGVAHDFNNLLTAISGYTAFAIGRLEQSDHDLRRDLEEVQHACERARGLTQQLLAFSRRQVLQPRALDLNEIVEETLRLLARLIGEDVELVTELDPDVQVVRADRGQLEQVLMNLAVNARDAMAKGGVLRLKTTNVDATDGHLPGIGDVAAGPYVRLCVEDTGCGMDAKTMEKAFDPFFTTKEVGQGTGLGLATVYGIVEQSGGHISVDSELGRGTTFAVYLPAVTDEVRRVRKAPALAPIGGDEHILLVEDEQVVRDLVRQMLEVQGYAVTAYADPEAALAAADELQFDLLVTDVVMPKMTGPELVERMTDHQPSLAVIYVSGYTSDAVLASGVSGEETAFLQKPFTIDELDRKVRSVLDAHQRIRSANGASVEDHRLAV